MEKHERIERNPLCHVQKVQSNGKQTRLRRAFTREEFQRLLAVSQARKPVYLTTVFTGLRRSELAALEWDDVHLNAAQPFLNVRASTTKNHKQAVIGLHEDVVTELWKLQAKRHSSANGLVFAALSPTWRPSRLISKRPTSSSLTPRISGLISILSDTPWQPTWRWLERNLPQDESSDVPSSILYYFPEYLTACHGNDLALV